MKIQFQWSLSLIRGVWCKIWGRREAPNSHMSPVVEFIMWELYEKTCKTKKKGYDA